jgi:hypothetical protein
VVNIFYDFFAITGFNSGRNGLASEEWPASVRTNAPKLLEPIENQQADFGISW